MENHCPYCGSANTRHTLSTKDYFLSKEKFDIYTCTNCGLVYTFPIPPRAAMGKYYQSENYLSHNTTQKGLIPTLYGMVRDYGFITKEKILLTYCKKERILDIGSGSGLFLNHLKNSGWKTTGVEFEDEVRDHSSKTLDLSLFKTLDELKGQKFGVITAWHVFEHIHELKKTLDQVYEILEPKGHFIIALPNHESYDAQQYKEYWAAYDVPRHLYHFSKETTTSIWSNHGFGLIKIHPLLFDSFYISIQSEKYKTGKQNLGKAFLTGLVSNVKAISQNPINHSSLIYVFQKN